MSASSQLPSPRLVITHLAKDGTSAFESDDQLTPFRPFGNQGPGFTLFHSTVGVPVSNVSSPPDLPAQIIPRCPASGVLFCTTDIPPDHTAPMHRTLSLDYAVVISGEIVLRLDGGDEKSVQAGEFIVQRGVNHELINRSHDVCRIAFVMVASEKSILEGGKELDETVFKK